jgi:type IV secretory pathway VirJ component
MFRQGRGWRDARARPVKRLMACLCVTICLASRSASAGRPGAGGSGSSPLVTVTTSRGPYDLRVYPPRDPSPDGSDSRRRLPDLGSGDSSAAGELPLILLISGEGGWRSFDELLAGWLSEAGYWVGGVDALKYFWDAQDDRELLADDFRAYAAALAKAAGRRSDSALLLAGFSFGADLAPWLAGARGWDGRVRGLLMIAPDAVGSLEFRISEILGFEPKDHVFQVAEALRSSSGTPVTFIHGAKDAKSAAPALSRAASDPKRLIVVPGANHHFSGKEADLRRALFEAARWLVKAGSRPSAPAEPER